MPLQSKTRYRATPAMVREGIRVLSQDKARKTSAASYTWQTKAKTRRGPRPSPRSVGDALYTPVEQVGPAYKKRKRDTLHRDLSLVSLLSLPDEASPPERNEAYQGRAKRGPWGCLPLLGGATFWEGATCLVWG